MTTRLPFFSDCVGWPEDKLPALHHIIRHGEDITRETFVSKIDGETRQQIERNLGYGRAFPITKDWHVAYRSVADLGIYYMVHSGIEIVFARPEQIEKAQAAYLAEEAADDAEAPGIDGLIDAVAVHLRGLDADGLTAIGRQIGAIPQGDESVPASIIRVLKAASPYDLVDVCNEHVGTRFQWTDSTIVAVPDDSEDDEADPPTLG